MSPISIRLAVPADRQALLRLAELDSAPAILGPALVAEVDERIVAARGLRSGQVIADPFERTRGLVGLLELQSAAVRPVAA